MNKNKPATTVDASASTTPNDAAVKRASTIASKREARIAERGYPLPLTLTCTVTGKSVNYTSPSYIAKVLSKYNNSLETLKSTFVSRAGRAEMKAKAAAAKP